MNEAAGTISYTVSLSGASAAPVTVNYATAEWYSDSRIRFHRRWWHVDIHPGETTKTFTVAITNDAVFEGAENFQVNLSTTNECDDSDR